MRRLALASPRGASSFRDRQGNDLSPSTSRLGRDARTILLTVPGVPAASLALAISAPPPADPSPPPPCVVYDRSGGYRATVTRHAVRRFADRVLSLEGVLEGLTDRDDVDALRGMGVDVRGIQDFLAYFGYRQWRAGSFWPSRTDGRLNAYVAKLRAGFAEFERRTA